MTGLSFASVARSGQHAVARWVSYHWNDDEPIIHRRRSELNAQYHTPPFCALYENWTVDEVLQEEAGKDRLVLCVVRDLLNWLSSWWHWRGYWPGEISNEERVRIWEENARALLDEHPDVVFIKFNDWFASRIYRVGVSKKLGVEHTDRAFRRFGGLEGGGSSFKDNSAGVLTRWAMIQPRHVRQDVYHPFDYINDDLLALNRQLFGDIYPHTIAALRKELNYEG